MQGSHGLLEDSRGIKALLLGNEAIARGILEAGIGVVTTYPGTPASEIGDAISEIAKDAGIYMEYSTNEIVATEVAAGAANCGIRALTAMKHVGLNVAADLVMTLAYAGVRGGYVIVTADDPECHSSQNEQDNRYYALLSSLPCLEPSSSQEAKDMTISAVEISEELELPVLLRTATRVSHTREPVTYGRLAEPDLKGKFVRDAKRLVMIPANSRPKHSVLLRKLEAAKGISERSRFNRVVREGRTGEVGLISSSSAFNYVAEAVDLLDLDASILKLGMIHPLPEKKIAEFLQKQTTTIVVEELEPFLETQIKAIAKDYAPNVGIIGKTSRSYFPRAGEFSTRIVMTSLAKITGKRLPIDFARIDGKYAEVTKGLPSRPPIMCVGCPHRASFYVIRKAAGESVISSTDIGCYALGATSPFKIGDIMICMGASIGTAQGISKATSANTLAIIGDSTFFHAGIPGLINAVYNNHRIVVAILDNHATAMTGHQPHPGTGKTGMGEETGRILIEDIALGLGVRYVKVVDPFETEDASRVIREALKTSGPSVVVFRAPCTLLALEERRKRGVKIEPAKVTDKCTNCMACVKLTGCPALVPVEGRLAVDETLCTACTLCISVCPHKAIHGGGSS